MKQEKMFNLGREGANYSAIARALEEVPPQVLPGQLSIIEYLEEQQEKKGEKQGDQTIML